MPPSEHDESGLTAVLIQQLSDRLKETTNLITTLTKEMRDNLIAHSELKHELHGLSENVKFLLSVIRGTNGGSKSLITRMVIVEKEQAEMKKMVDRTVTLRDTAKVEKETEDIRGKWQLRASFVIGILGLLGSIVALWKR